MQPELLVKRTLVLACAFSTDIPIVGTMKNKTAGPERLAELLPIEIVAMGKNHLCGMNGNDFVEGKTRIAIDSTLNFVSPDSVSVQCHAIFAWQYNPAGLDTTGAHATYP